MIVSFYINCMTRIINFLIDDYYGHNLCDIVESSNLDEKEMDNFETILLSLGSFEGSIMPKINFFIMLSNGPYLGDLLVKYHFYLYI